MKILFVAFLVFAAASMSDGQIRTDFDREMNAPVEPFQIIENIYYVGTADLGVYLITTGNGHILIDGGFEETATQIESNIEKLGFKLTDVKIILTNHAHSDHAGGLAILKKKSGAKLYATKKQTQQLKRGGKDDFAFGDSLSFTPVSPDKRIQRDGRIALGGMTLRATFTPGHTKGCTSFSTTVETKTGSYQVMFLGSTSALDYDLIKNKKYKNIAKDFESTFNSLRSLKVDVFLASHAGAFEMKEKLEKLTTNPGTNPFIDPDGYRNFIASAEKTFKEKLAKQKATHE